MNKPAFQVTIPEPCHENWGDMTPREQGRFCSVCTKTVVDFSAMTDTQMFDVLKNGAGSMCGHFHKDQLERTITAPKKPKWILQPFWKYFLGLIMFFKPAASKAQGKPVCTPVIPEPHRTVGMIAVDPQKKIEREITGTVVNESNNPVGGAIINIKGTTKFAPADTKGNFKIKARIGDVLEVTDLQYDANTYRIGSENNIRITLSKAVFTQHMAGEIAVIPVSKPVEMLIDVIDKGTGLLVKNASISWFESYAGNPDRMASTGAKGTVKTNISLNQPEITFTVKAEGYTVTSTAFNSTELNGKRRIKLYVEQYVEEKIMGKVAVSPNVPLDVTLNNKPPLASDALQPPNTFQEWICSVPGVFIQPVNPAVPVVPKKKLQGATILVRKQISFYPNPVKKDGKVTMLFNNDEAETCMAQVTDMQGKIIINHRFDAAKGANQVAIPLADNMTGGTYVLNLMNSKGQWVATEKVVVE